jgi:integrase
MPLTEVAVRKAQPEDKPQKLFDGGGLFLLVQPKGAKYWRLDYRFAGKRKTLSLGVYPETSLSKAREGRIEARKLLANGTDPSATKQAAKRVKATETRNNFEMLAREYHAHKSPTWTAGHAKQWLLNIERYALPVFGGCAISEIEPLQVLEVLRKMEARGTYETRDRLGQSIGAVFKYAIATGRARYNPAADIRAALADSPKAKNFACLATNELPDFLRALTDYQSLARVSPIGVTATRLLMLTATRTSEVRYAQWKDFDLEAGVWVIPEEQTGRKGKQGKRKSHTVPLSSQAVAILRDLYPMTGQGAHVFPNRNDATRVISENTVLKVIEGMGYRGKMTGHGFRSLARSLLGEMGHRREVLEAMLSHSIENATEAAYVRTTYIEERRIIMQAWADYLQSIEVGAVVITLRAA